MCGIAGIASPTPVPVSPETLARMGDTLAHRGPDDHGTYTRPGVGLVHRRLSIIDLSEAGRQPIGNEDGSIQVILNGEIYNYRTLRSELVAGGHRFRTATDTEVLVHLYEDEGPDFVRRLRGMFAFALWDEPRQRLLLCRDRLGVKPLYFAQSSDSTLIFGSEIKALLASGRVEADLNVGALSEFLGSRYTTGRETMYEGIVRLLPGELAEWQGGRLTTRPYWSLVDASEDLGRASPADLVTRFRDLFEESVRLRMISDAPIGVFLSGGIDSSAIAAVMARHSTQPLRTFSVGFAERQADELSYARLMAGHLGADHQEVVVSADEYFSALPRLIWHEDEPIAFPSSVPLYFVSRLATGSVKVVLTGEGSDELLGGYAKYWKAELLLRLGRGWRAVPDAVRERLGDAVLRLPTGRLRSVLMRTPLVREPTVRGLFLENFGVFDGPAQQRLLTPAFQDRLRESGAPSDPFQGHLDALELLRDLPTLDQLLTLDMGTYLRELLMKQDQMSMAASLESRVPFLDHHLVAFSRGLPRAMKRSGFRTKRILRDAVKDLVPREILARRKWGFPTPVGGWLRGRWTHVLDEVLFSERARARGIFDPKEVGRLVLEHRTGHADHTERLWALLNVELWLQTCVDSSAAAATVV